MLVRDFEYVTIAAKIQGKLNIMLLKEEKDYMGNLTLYGVALCMEVRGMTFTSTPPILTHGRSFCKVQS